MTQTYTLYVDGACRGNPGLGGWGAYILWNDQSRELCGGEFDTTNNRMELTAAIKGIEFCPKNAKLIVWTDSTYVQKGITEWIHGWKAKQWKGVKNPDLWQKLDAVCQGREVEWHWVKGHAGHEGNEKADALANQGADLTASGQKAVAVAAIHEESAPTQTPETDWLLDDPFGLETSDFEENSDDEENGEFEEDRVAEDVNGQQIDTEQANTENNISSERAEQAPTHSLIQEKHSEQQSNNKDVSVAAQHPQVVITPATLHLEGPRQLILDTETTGFYYQDGDRIVEVGAIEMVNRKLTGSSIHIYINPEKPVGESENIHGISDEFLKDKPKFAEIADVLYQYLKGAEIIAHNATFDMNFLDMEFNRAKFGALSDVCSVTDTLIMAKNKHPGQKNSLDALVRRYEIIQRDRTFHGALLDAEILADVYLAMTGGQVTLDIDQQDQHSDGQQQQNQKIAIQANLKVIEPSEEELAAHNAWVEKWQEKNGTACIFAQLSAEHN